MKENKMISSTKAKESVTNIDSKNQSNAQTKHADDDIIRTTANRTMEETLEKKFPKAEVMMLPIDKLVVAPQEWNFFKSLSKERFEELIRSIKRYGLQHNLVVQALADDTFRILSGHQRVEACKKLFEETGDKKYKTVPCKVYKDGQLVEEDARRIIIVTNTAQRGDLTLEDRVRSVNELTKLEKTKAFYGSEIDVKKKVAKILGVSRSAVFKLQNLSSLDEQLFELCGNKCHGKAISVREGEVLSKLTPEQQQHIFVSDYYHKLTPNRLAALKILTKESTTEDIDKIFTSEAEYCYNVVTTVQRPENFDTIGIHVKREEKVMLGAFLKEAIAGNNTLSMELKSSLEKVAKELTESVNQTSVNSAS